MEKNDLLKYKNNIIRILEINNDKVFVIDCCKKTIPYWTFLSNISKYLIISEQAMLDYFNISFPDMNNLDYESIRIMNLRFTMISSILPYISNFQKRNKLISSVSIEFDVCRQTIINYLIAYLIFQNKAILIPKTNISQKTLSYDEENYRWALNKFFYNKNKNSLKTAYTFMLKEKYCKADGTLISKYPTFNQFRYFYRKTKNIQTELISRNGIKNYQRNHRPLLGDSIQEYAKNIGIGMLDSTICDIYLINEQKQIVGRPILTACIDAYSSLCCGYTLSWEGGVYSLRGLMLNIITNKKSWCEKYGIIIDDKEWNCNQIPATLITDMGAEYTSDTFGQIAELGIKLVNLPPFRPELKGSVEKFFDVIQNMYKPFLKSKGVVEPDYQQRGVHDYRKDACLTMNDFEKIIIRCIIFYNSQRVLNNFPYDETMIAQNIKPYANCVWEYGKTQSGASLISINKDRLMLTLLPRTTGKFNRNGLMVNKMRYKYYCHKSNNKDDYTNRYIIGGNVTVAYNPDNVSYVWLVENNDYICFELIEKRYSEKELTEVQSLKEKQKEIIQNAEKGSTQKQIDLANHILTIANQTNKPENISAKNIRETRINERKHNHVDYMKGGEGNE